MTSLDPLRGTPAWGAGEGVPDLLSLLPPRFEQPALCAETDPEIWFPDKGENAKVQEAKRVCKRCPAMEECLQWALDHDEHGVWGGTSRVQRLRMQQRRPDRPRQLAPCGTAAGYRRHSRAKEPACEACKRAEALRWAMWQEKRKGGAA